MLRSAALNIITAMGVEGGCNCQFALNPDTFEYAVIEVNPRVSRSSALASKATGYPIAKVASKIAVGFTLDEIENAGVDKRKALDLLLASDKIIVMATHDPVLALAADRRLVFEQGAVAAVLARTPAEDTLLARLEDMERHWSDVREALRKGADMSPWII